MRIFKSSKQKAFLLSVVATIVMTLVFQNCSQARLEKIDLSSSVSLPPLSLKAHICPQARFSEGEATKYVFIIDLSASNFGNQRPELVNGAPTGWSHWDPALATDPTGERFEAIKYFLDTCSNQAGAQFALIGFSNSAGVIGNGKFSCDNVGFTTKDTIKSQLSAFSARQEQDKLWWERWVAPRVIEEVPPDSVISQNTSYSSASSCLERLVTDDLTTNSGNQTDNYFVFFISDGLPRDKYDSGCESSDLKYTPQEKVDCYVRTSVDPLVLSRTAAISRGKNLQLQGVFYGDTSAELPLVLDELSKKGGTPEVVKLASFQSKTSLCELVATQSAISFRPDIYMSLNMNVIRKNGEMHADSDMDGLTDQEEVALGYDPHNPRSSGISGVLDGVCERLGGYSSCQSARSLISCDPNKYDKLGLTDCDLTLLKIKRDPLNGDSGVDFDLDGIPDFVEVVKGTDPAFADDSQDPDGDNRSTREELISGTDPFTPDSNIPLAQLNGSKIYFNANSPAPSCSAGDWTLSVDRVQMVETKAVQGLPLAVKHQEHLKNEQKVLMLYRLSPVNSVTPQLEYYTRMVTVRASDGGQGLTSSQSELHPEDFSLLGRIQQ